MIVTAAYFSCKPDARGLFLGEMDLLVQATRQEAGCISFSLYESVEAKNRFLLLEEWRDSSALDEHKKLAHYARFNGLAQQMFSDKVVHNYPVEKSN
ncbi:MAG TPA: putative quinol monooxygenase [Clostridia bacterium]|nr:putative quinol monooxygenase [Clostridia bacterium]